MIKKFIHNDLIVLILRLLILYVIMLILQVTFYFHNQSLLGDFGWSDVPLMIKGALKFDTVSILYINWLFIIFSLLPFHFREKGWYQKALFWIYTVSNTISLIFLNIADCMYYKFSYKRISLEEMHFFEENDNTFSIMLKAMGENWYLILLAAVLIVFMVFCYKKIKYYPTQIGKKNIYYPVCTLILAVSVLISIIGIRGSHDWKARPIAPSNAAYYTHSTLQASVVLSNPFCTLRMIGVKKFEVLNYMTDGKAASLYTPYHQHDTFVHELGEMNVVVFVLESFSREHSQFLAPNLNPDYSFTPFLDSLMRKGFVFTHAHSNGVKSIESLPSILLSIPSYRVSFPLIPEAIGEMEGLPNILAKKGYGTYFFCGATENQMGFEAIGKMAGIQRFYNRTHFEHYNKQPNMSNVWGIWDMDFLQFTAHELKQLKTPFFATIYTLTSHHPFVLPEEYKDKMPKGGTDLQPCVAYTDLSIRKFFNTASKSSWFNNTLFIFVADHASGYIAHKESSTSRGGTSIIYFMYTPNHSLQGRCDQVAQQIDIMPTVLGLLGYNQPYFAFGRDYFNEPERPAIATNCVNQIYQYLTDSLSLYFDGEKTIHAYSARDTFQEHDILDMKKAQQNQGEEYLKAILQTYSKHIFEKDYRVKH